MNILRITIRLTLIGAHLLVGVLLCVFALPSDWNSTGAARRRGDTVVRWWLYVCTRIIGIRIRAHGKPVTGASLVVVNHVSWMDIVIVGSLQPVSFLSKVEIARWPIVGYLARKAGTLFINRGTGAGSAAQLIGKRLRAGGSVAFFPEGTTSDGTEIHRFHPRLFTPVMDTHTPVQPVSIAYPCSSAPDGVHPKAYFSRDVPFFTHALAVIAEPRIHAVVRYADSLPGDDLPDGDRRQLAEKAREAVVTEHCKDR